MPGHDAAKSVLFSGLLTHVGVPHGFTTRFGGVSADVYESFNFGNPSDTPLDDRDPAENIRQNRARLLAHIGATGRELVEVHQVHGDAVHEVHAGAAGRQVEEHDPKADAIVCDDPSRLIGIRVADCCPVLIASEDGSLVAAVHAGWRGAAMGVAVRAVESMMRIGGVRPREIVAAIGPCIGFESFEVGPEVASAFRDQLGESTAVVQASDVPGKFKLDLKGVLREQLMSAGVLGVMIETRPECTVRSTDASGRPMFFSHRRDRGKSGRMTGVIGPRSG